MAKLFNYDDVRNRPKRNGFDISEHRFFTAKAGELLPCYVAEVTPGNKLRINPKSFTRTQPLQTAAFTRLKEQVEFFFVPTRLLWSKFDEWVVQSKAPTPTSAVVQRLAAHHPWMSTKDVQQVLSAAKLSYLSGSSDSSFLYSLDEGDLPIFGSSIKLLESLGYGHIFSYYKPSAETSANGIVEDMPSLTSTGRYLKDLDLNPFPLMAYQKIYADYYRDSQWQDDLAYTWNCDYLTAADRSGSKLFTATNFATAASASGKLKLTPWIMAMRYRNYRKDMFMGLLPHAQFGNAIHAPLDLTSAGTYSTQQLSISLNAAGGGTVGDPVTEGADYVADVGTSLPNDGSSNIGIDLLTLRKCEALLRWAEIQGTSKQHYEDLIYKHFGVKVRDAGKTMSTFLGSFDSDLIVNEVMNTNLSTSSDQAVAKGQATGSVSGRPIDFDVPEHGLVIGIYSVIPQLDYSCFGTNQLNLKTEVEQYFQPEFDRLGLEPVSKYRLLNIPAMTSNNEQVLGYGPRYLDYKAHRDCVLGDFNFSRADYAAPLTYSQLAGYMLSQSNPILSYTFFKVKPKHLDSIFGVNANGSVVTDNFNVAITVDVKKVAEMDVDGMPY